MGFINFVIILFIGGSAFAQTGVIPPSQGMQSPQIPFSGPPGMMQPSIGLDATMSNSNPNMAKQNALSGVPTEEFKCFKALKVVGAEPSENNRDWYGKDVVNKASRTEFYANLKKELNQLQDTYGINEHAAHDSGGLNSCDGPGHESEECAAAREEHEDKVASAPVFQDYIKALHACRFQPFISIVDTQLKAFRAMMKEQEKERSVAPTAGK